MTVLYVNRLPGIRSSQSRDGRVQVHEVYESITDSDNDTADIILADSRLPVLNQQYAVARNLFCSRVDPQQDRRSYRKWLTNVTWENFPNQYLEISPLDEPAEIALDEEQYTKRVYRDIEGELLTNTAGEIIIDEKGKRGIEVEDSRWVFKVKKNVRSIPTYILELNNRVNKNTITVQGLRCKKRTLMCKGMRGSPIQRKYINGRIVEWIEMSFRLHYRPEGWTVKVPNLGYHYKTKGEPYIARNRFTGQPLTRRVTFTDITGQSVTINTPIFKTDPILKRIVDEEGVPVQEPYPLDRKGMWLPFDHLPSEVIDLEPDVVYEGPFHLLPLR